MHIQKHYARTFCCITQCAFVDQMKIYATNNNKWPNEKIIIMWIFIFHYISWNVLLNLLTHFLQQIELTYVSCYKTALICFDQFFCATSSTMIVGDTPYLLTSMELHPLHFYSHWNVNKIKHNYRNAQTF